MASSYALQSSFELANSKFVEPFFLIALDKLNPLPSSMFFLTLNSGFGGYFLASTPVPQELNQKGRNDKKNMNLKILFENMLIKVNLLNYHHIYCKNVEKYSKLRENECCKFTTIIN